MEVHPLTGIRDLQKWIDTELIGASYLLFVNSVAYVQDNANTFVGQPASKRKELLLEIVKAGDYDKYYEQARGTLSALSVDKNRLIGQLTELESRRVQIESSLNDRVSLESNIKEYEIRRDNASAKREELETQRAQNLALLNEIQRYDEQIRKLKSNISELERDIFAKGARINQKYENQVIIDSGRETPALLDAYKVTLQGQRDLFITYTDQDEIRQKMKDKKPSFEDLTQEIRSAAEQTEMFRKRPVCPSGDNCPYQKQVNSSIEYGEKRIVELATRNSESAARLATWQKEFDALPAPGDKRALLKAMRENEDAINQLESKLRKIEMAKQDTELIAAMERELPVVETKLAGLRKELEETLVTKASIEEKCTAEVIEKWTAELTKYRGLEQEFTQKVSDALSTLKKLDQDLAEIESLKERVVDIHENKLTAVDSRIEKVAAVKEAFGSNGIKTMVIDYLLPKLEDRINEVLTKFSDFHIRLNTQKQTANGEGVVEGLFILTYNEFNEEMPFENLSGGEKTKVSVAISEALATLQKCSFRIFDEFVTALDSNSLEGFMSSIVHLQKQYPQMLMISHVQEIKDLFDNHIKIIKKNGTSIIEI
jgi:exonuclease SbcC